jgi:N-acetylglucosaminyldiphosphoundecaprenol N-acetyl-beta-D-mannosaminyltransferase
LVIYGVPFHNVTFEEAIDWIVARVKSGRPANIATANLDFVTRAWSDPELQRILIDADLVLADGFPVVKLAPFFGPALKDRVTGSDLTPMLAERAAKEGMSIYGLGSAAGVAEKAMEILKARHPDLKVAGTYSPSYAPLLEMDHRKILQKLAEAKPDILFVALGAPKQDKFISMHVRGWNVPVAMGVGASLDFITGEQKRAPRWMRNHHVEWLWRVCCNPRRLFLRYCANVRFLFSASRQMFLINRMADKPRPFQMLDEDDVFALEDQGIAVERFQGLGNEAAARDLVQRIAGTAMGMNVLVDLHAVPWLDSLELGALLEINKICRSWGKRLILYASRPKVLRLLDTCRLTDYFNTATRLDEVEAIANNLAEHLDGGTLYAGGALTLELPMELTSATLPFFEKEAGFLHHELREQGILKTVEVDASRLDFIDSSGLGFLISLKKTTQDEGVSMSIANLPSKPRRTFEIARVDKVLLHA